MSRSTQQFNKVMIMALTVLLFVIVSVHVYAEKVQVNAEIEVFFPPEEGEAAEAAIVREINQAKKIILAQAYSFTSVPIELALTNAIRRGVDVRIIVDREQNGPDRHSRAFNLKAAGGSVFVDMSEGLQHNKVVVIDAQTVISGSFNFSKQAKINRENLQIIHSLALARTFGDNWLRNLKRCQSL